MSLGCLFSLALPESADKSAGVIVASTAQIGSQNNRTNFGSVDNWAGHARVPRQDNESGIHSLTVGHVERDVADPKCLVHSKLF